MSDWQALEALADGRQLWRLPTALAGQFSPGQSLQIADQRLPILRAEPEALVVVAVQPISGTGTLVGHALAISAPQSLLLISHDDGLFAILAWLFRHRRQVPAGALRLLAVFSGPLPFRPQPSRYLTPALPPHVTAALPLLDDWQIVSRIVHPDGLPGCYDEDVENLVTAWCEPSDRIMVVR